MMKMVADFILICVSSPAQELSVWIDLRILAVVSLTRLGLCGYCEQQQRADQDSRHKRQDCGNETPHCIVESVVSVES
jgi:hypothetical protein